MNRTVLVMSLFSLALVTGPLKASVDQVSVKAKVEQVAKRVGADAALIDEGVPVHAAIRSQKDAKIVNEADNILALSAAAAAKAAEREGVYCTLENCPHTLGLEASKRSLDTLSAELAKGKAGLEGRATLKLAAQLHHAAAGILLASRTQVITADPAVKFRRSETVRMRSEVKLELAERLAATTEKLLDVTGR